jgi:hypothetical protein
VLGLGLWLALSLQTAGVINLPGGHALSAASSNWRRWLNSAASSTSPATPRSAGTITGALPLASAALACANSGVNVVGSNLTIPESEVVCGDVLVTGGNLDLHGSVRGSVQDIGGDATVAGDVTGDVTVIGGNLTIEPGASIAGATHDIGGTMTNDSGMRLTRGTDPNLLEPTDRARAPGLGFSVDVGSFWLGLLFWMSAALGLCAVAPEMVGRVRYSISRHVAVSGITGAIVGSIALVVALLMLLTCIGIPLALLLVAVTWFAWVVGTVALGAWIGSVVFGGPRHTPSLVVSALLGVLVLCLLKELPVAGPIITGLSGLIAVGGASLTLLSARRAPYAVYKR